MTEGINTEVSVFMSQTFITKKVSNEYSQLVVGIGKNLAALCLPFLAA